MSTNLNEPSDLMKSGSIQPQDIFEKVTDQVGQVILGKKEQIRLALCCLLSEGHLLIEDIPGIGKTTLAKMLSETLGLDFRRIQCTSDMLPGDILGVSIFDQNTGTFKFHPGPIFTQVLLSDEINRATPKTQSALLEAMEERQVTTEGKTRPLPQPFFVIATQNPLEQVGTFPLPESQLDRFLIRIELGYPDRTSEQNLLREGGTGKVKQKVSPMLSPQDIILYQKMAAGVHVSNTLIEYIQNILDFTRTSHELQLGLSPRAGLFLLRSSRSWAFINGRDFVLPEDVQKMLPYVVGHRLRQVDGRGEMSREELMGMLLSLPVPV